MTMHLVDGEPAFDGWRAVDIPELAGQLMRRAGDVDGRPVVLAVDGHGASGKSTFADQLRDVVPGAVVVSTDDLAWHEPFFGWGHLLRQLLTELHEAGAAQLVPPQWPARGREGAVDIPAGTSMVVVEGTGAALRDVADLLDVVVWVQSDFAESERRGIARDDESGVNGDHEQTVAFWHEWMGHERAHFRQDRPWERADLIVAGTPVVELADGQVAVSVLEGGTVAR